MLKHHENCLNWNVCAELSEKQKVSANIHNPVIVKHAHILVFMAFINDFWFWCLSFINKQNDYKTKTVQFDFRLSNQCCNHIRRKVRRFFWFNIGIGVRQMISRRSISFVICFVAHFISLSIITDVAVPPCYEQDLLLSNLFEVTVFVLVLPVARFVKVTIRVVRQMFIFIPNHLNRLFIFRRSAIDGDYSDS